MRPNAHVVLLAVAIGGVFAAWPAVSRAQSAACTVHVAQEARQEEARTRFGQGQELAAASRFAEALAAYECSFQNVPHPSTLYNIARAAELTGDFRRALDAWRGYLRMNPEAEDRESIDQRIAALEGSLGTGGPTPTPGVGVTPTPMPGPPPPAAAGAPQTWETPRGAETDVYSPGSAGQEYQIVERRPPSPWRWYSWYIMGTGALVGLVGLVLALPDGAMQVCVDTASVDGEYDPLNACAITGYAMLGVGAALIISAGLIFLFSEPGGEYVVTRRASLAPRLAFDEGGRVTGGGATWSMRF